ncbi:MAG TPA: site-specific integrase, partial [Syntrophales bacterium]|nr:site-specific integrase [Syntrophales bacterium]
WGNIPLSHITERHIDKLITDMIRDGLAIPTVNKNVRHVKAALGKAYKWKYIKCPVEFPSPMEEEERVRYLSSDQLRLIIGQTDDAEFADFCLLSAYTGLRSGELMRLIPGDIDNPPEFIRVSPKQKNKKESRVPINSSARVILTRSLRRGHKKVFRFTCRTWVSQKFKECVVKAGLKDARFHDLRHTYGSHLAMSGENQKTIQELMRHKSPASTEIYTKLSPDHLKQASEKVNYGPMPVPITHSKSGTNKP